MERDIGESFEDYKVRRALSNAARASINIKSRGGTQANHRATRPRHKGTGIKGIKYTSRSQYGAGIAASAASRRVTAYLTAGHQQHLAKIAVRKERRAAEADAKAKASKPKRNKTAAQLNYDA